MPTPVPLKILNRREQRVRLIIVLLLAIGTGVAARLIRPYFSGPPHPEAIGALVVLSAACVVLLLGLRRMSYARGAAVFSIEATALWVCFTVGWIIVGGPLLGELLIVTSLFWASTVVLGLVALGVIQSRWPPRRLMTCPVCEYGLRGLSRSVCPECGHRFEATCASCGYALTELASGECPDCRSALTTDTVS